MDERREARVSAPLLMGFGLVGLAAILWGSSAAAVRAFGDETGSPGAVAAFAEAVIAAPLLLAAGSASRRAWPRLRDALPASLLTGSLVSGFLLSYFTAIGQIGVMLASLIAICSAPLFTAALAWLFLDEQTSGRVWRALALGVLGTGLVIVGQAPGASGEGGGRLLGALLALCAGLCFGAENVVVRRLMARFHPTQLAALTTCATVFFLAPFAVAAGGLVQATIDGWIWLLYLAVFPTALAPALHNAGLRRVPVVPASIVGLLEPLTAAVFGSMVFDETIGAVGTAGAVLLFLAIAVLYLAQREREAIAGPAWSLTSSGPAELQER